MWCLLVLLCSQGAAFSAGFTAPFTLGSEGTQHMKHRNPEDFMNVSEMIRYHGYPCEEYEVTTKDGYILGVFRIPSGRNMQNTDVGYDVWLGNSRGNTWSSKHKTLKPCQKEFWQFSFHEIGIYDLPAELYFIMNKTGQKDVYYVGHSEGSTAGFVAFSTYPELAQRVKVFFALGPVATITYATSPFVKFARLPQPLIRLLLGCKGVLRQNELTKGPATLLCATLGKLCASIFCFIAGGSIQNLNTSRTDAFVAHYPAGTSVQNTIHWHQYVHAPAYSPDYNFYRPDTQHTDPANGGKVAHADRFQAYDYGLKENMKKYNQPTPPAYNIERISTPIAVWSGGQDKFAGPKDIAKLLSQITNLCYYKHIPEWGHLDFVWGLDATERMYRKIIELMIKYA
ncbi:lysosomal acid lipase/cholesteryl ester hydrolase-like [Cygnus atratus]|uniref:lysosomal acid lipase/cholesteryl ester hydrolase-like n=1 Tax=Cygnus atratus TaxID=8868 RepID=UPI0021B73047|nr:lysosomal acid lipase/cholesteryl ester hydrolase-like [Cygnus atratus]